MYIAMGWPPSRVSTTLAIGWAFGVAITACVMSFVIWNAIRALTLGFASKMSVLENNCMQSTASAAGYSTGGTMVSAIAALLLLSPTPEHPFGKHLPVGVLVGWTVFLAILGVVLAIPMFSLRQGFAELPDPAWSDL